MGIKFSEILTEICTFSFKKMHFKMSSAKWRIFYLYLNKLRCVGMYILCHDSPMYHATSTAEPKFTKKTPFNGLGIRIKNRRRSSDCLSFIKMIPIPVRRCIFW